MEIRLSLFDFFLVLLFDLNNYNTLTHLCDLYIRGMFLLIGCFYSYDILGMNKLYSLNSINSIGLKRFISLIRSEEVYS